jgi:starch-binding outer membrane protein, SusD/RagB family
MLSSKTLKITIMRKYKLYKYLFAVLIGLIAFCSCTDLKEQPYTFIDPDSFYQNESQLNQGLNSVYTQFRTMAGNYKYIMRLECCTDFGQPCYTKEDCPLINCWYDINNASTYTFTTVWSQAYSAINKANLILARGEDVSMDATSKARVYAQARFMRAYSYFILVRLYGGVPIPATYTKNLSGLEIPRQSVETVYNYIIADLEYCEANLPVRGTSGYDVWRASQGASQALLGEVYLTRASMEGNTAYYQKCVDYCQKVIDSKVYSLITDYKNLWYAFNANAKNNAESIFELQYCAVSGQENNMHRQFGLGNSITVPGFGSYFYHRYGPSIYAWQSYASTDTRLGAFITSYTYNGLFREFVASDKGFYPGSKNWLTSTPGNAKYYDFQTSATLQLPCANFYMLRYSEVLLNYAEAKNQLSGGSSDAFDKLKEVHQRAGLTDYDSMTTMSQSDMDNAIFQERGWEFIGEGKIYYDELRTNRLGSRVSTFVAQGVADGMYQFQKLNFVPKKSFLWKIPQSDLDSNPALVQNPDNISD